MHVRVCSTRVIAGMVGQAHVSEDNNLGSHGIQKGSIVGDHNHRRGLQRLQIALQHAPDQIICMLMTHQPQDAALIFSTLMFSPRQQCYGGCI